MDLAGKVAVVTGASRGIGAQIAVELAKGGADLFITWSPSQASKSRADGVLAKIQEVSSTGKAFGIGIDFSLPGAPSQVIQAFLQHYQHIDILVNNAGTALLRGTANTTLEDYTSLMTLNLSSPFFLTQAAIPHLRHPARIIHISSVAARLGFPIGVAYAMSKGGLEAMTRAQAKEFGPQGTTVNAVAPGLVMTDLIEGWGKDALAEEALRTPVSQRIGEVDDVAQTVAWLASESSRWVSGQTISCSGAVLMV